MEYCTAEGSSRASVLLSPVGRGDPFDVPLSDEQAGVTIEAGGDGLHENDLTIEDHTPTDDPDYLMSSVVRFTNTTAFDEATVTLSLPEETATFETQTTAANETAGNVTTQTQSQQEPPYAIYRWDPRTAEGWEPLDTDINMDEGTATAEIDGPGYLAVLDKPAWNDALTATITLEDRHFAGNETAATWDWEDNNFETDWYNPGTGKWVVNDGVARWKGSFDTKRYRTDEISQPVDDRIRLSFEGKIDGEWADYINIRLRNAAGEQLLRAGIGHDNYNGYGPLVEFNAATLDERNLVTNARLSAGEWVQTDIWYNPQAGTCRIVASGPTTSIDANISPSACEGSISGERIESLEISGWSHSGGEQVRNVQLSVSEDGGEVPPSERTLRDTNGDGIPDAVAEADPLIPQLHPGLGGVADFDGSSSIDIDPVLTDTDGDGLADADTIDVDYQVYKEDGELKLDTHVKRAKAHPAYYDTDDDGFSDYEEVKVWETSPWTKDTSGDGFLDSVDPNPKEKTTPPVLDMSLYEDFKGRSVVEPSVRPTGAAESIEKLEWNVFVEGSWLPFDDDTWINETERNLGDTTYKTIIPNDEPDIIIAEAVGEHGGVTRIEYDVTDDSNDLTVYAGAFASGTAQGSRIGGTIGSASPDIATTIGGILVGGLILGSAAALEVESSTEAEVVREDLSYEIPGSSIEAEYEVNGEEISLPAGAVYETTSVDGTEYTRGFGLEYIEATTGVTFATIHSILDNPDKVVTDDGEVQYIIGESVIGGDETILEIIGGTIATASSGETIEDTCRQEVYIPEKSENDHPYKQGIDKNDIKDALKNPFNDKVWTDGTLLYYVSQASNGVWHIVRTSPDNPFAPWGVSTTLVNADEFNNGQEAEEYLEEEGKTEYNC